MKAPWTRLDQLLDKIDDPVAGLELLAKRPEGATPAQAHNLLFWEIQFTQWRDWRAGNVQAVTVAVLSCALNKRPQPRWLNKAIFEVCEQRMSRRDRDAPRKMRVHFIRWQKAESEYRQRQGHLRYRKKKIGDADWEAAAAGLAGTDAACRAETVKKSHQLVKRAGGAQATLASYRREVKKRDQRRRRYRKKI